jgi:hypothetical protein
MWYMGRRCESGACVEVAVAGDEVLVRSSVTPATLLTLSREEWREFLAGAKDGFFDHL